MSRRCLSSPWRSPSASLVWLCALLVVLSHTPAPAEAVSGRVRASLGVTHSRSMRRVTKFGFEKGGELTAVIAAVKSIGFDVDYDTAGQAEAADESGDGGGPAGIEGFFDQLVHPLMLPADSDSAPSSPVTLPTNPAAEMNRTLEDTATPPGSNSTSPSSLSLSLSSSSSGPGLQMTPTNATSGSAAAHEGPAGTLAEYGTYLVACNRNGISELEKFGAKRGMCAQKLRTSNRCFSWAIEHGFTRVNFAFPGDVVAYVGLVSCDTSVTHVQMSYQLMNPGGEHLGTEFHPMSTVYACMTGPWTLLVLATAFNLVAFREAATQLHSALAAAFVTKCAALALNSMSWSQRSERGRITHGMKLSVGLVEGAWQVGAAVLLMLISRGWRVTRAQLSPADLSTVQVCGALLALFYLVDYFVSSQFVFGLAMSFVAVVTVILSGSSKVRKGLALQLSVIYNHPYVDHTQSPVFHKSQMYKYLQVSLFVFLIALLVCEVCAFVFADDPWGEALGHELDIFMFACAVAFTFRLRELNPFNTHIVGTRFVSSSTSVGVARGITYTNPQDDLLVGATGTASMQDGRGEAEQDVEHDHHGLQRMHDGSSGSLLSSDARNQRGADAGMSPPVSSSSSTATGNGGGSGSRSRIMIEVARSRSHHRGPHEAHDALGAAPPDRGPGAASVSHRDASHAGGNNSGGVAGGYSGGGRLPYQCWQKNRLSMSYREQQLVVVANPPSVGRERRVCDFAVGVVTSKKRLPQGLRPYELVHNYYIEKNNKLNEHNRLQQHPVSSSSDVMSPDHRMVNDRKPFLSPSVRRSSCGNGRTAVVPSSHAQSQNKRAAAAEGAGIPGVDGVSGSVRSGEVLAIMGPSGSGKTSPPASV